jgi:hypothetical protein
MTGVSDAVRAAFNPYPKYQGARHHVPPDTWRGLTKEEKCGYGALLAAAFFGLDGGDLERGPMLPQTFPQRGSGKTSTAELSDYFRGSRAGTPFAFTSKPITTRRATAAKPRGEYVIELDGKLYNRNAGSKIIAAKKEPRGTDELDDIEITTERDDRAWEERSERQIKAAEHPRFDADDSWKRAA